ncbi:MAG: hypothetical protein WA190_02330 [Usitatibacter sp.]
MKSLLIRELTRRNLIREPAVQTNRSTEDVRDILCKHTVQQ